MSYISLSDLSIGYDGQTVAEHINARIDAGDYLCIVGENGAGKSTLMKTLLHLTKPLSGEIRYGDGIQADEVGYLPQQTIVQRDFPASVWEIVLSGNIAKSGLRPFYTKEEKECARKNMERMGIWELRKKSYRNLSGGQQQRVLLARALCASAKILFLDEPVSGLDPKVTADFYRLLQQINQEGITILMVSHDIQAVFSFASHILHVGSKSAFFGTLEEYKKSGLYKGFLEEIGEVEE